MSFLNSIEIDFEAIEFEIEEQGRRIVWDSVQHGEEIRQRIYKAINRECVFEIENGKHANPCELVQWIIDALIEECEAIGIEIEEIEDDDQN
jgi:hypothetical protein